MSNQADLMRRAPNEAAYAFFATSAILAPAPNRKASGSRSSPASPVSSSPCSRQNSACSDHTSHITSLCLEKTKSKNPKYIPGTVVHRTPVSSPTLPLSPSSSASSHSFPSRSSSTSSQGPPPRSPNTVYSEKQRALHFASLSPQQKICYKEGHQGKKQHAKGGIFSFDLFKPTTRVVCKRCHDVLSE